MKRTWHTVALCCGLMIAISGCSRQQSDWQKTREANTTDAYEQFLKKYPSGEFTAQAQARVKELYEERDWQKARDADTPEAYQAFLKQYPEGKWTEEARIRVENFTLAQSPAGSTTNDTGGSAAGDTGTPDGAGVSASGTNGSTPRRDAAADDDATVARVTTSAAQPATAAGTGSKSASAATPAAHVHQSAAASGNSGVQFGAFKSGEAAAHRRWALLQQDYPSLLMGLNSKVVPTNTPSGTLYRLQALGLTEKHAQAICNQLKSRSQPCLVLPPASG